MDNLGNFYKQDAKKYNLLNNKELISLLMKMKKGGYKIFTSLECFQELIDFLTIWYEIKYPEKEMNFYDGKYITYYQLEDLSKHMTIEQLIYRLTEILD